MLAILIVSDTKRLRKQMSDYLEEGDFGTVRAASSDEEAREMMGLEGHQPAEPWGAVLFDFKDTDDDGFRIVQSFKSRPRSRNTPVLAVIRRANPRLLQKIFSTGCEDVVQTPLDDMILRHRVQNYIRPG